MKKAVCDISFLSPLYYAFFFFFVIRGRAAAAAAGKQYPMAVLRGAYMTPEAADVRAAMAQTAVTAFDRLAKEQVSTESNISLYTDL